MAPPLTLEKRCPRCGEIRPRAEFPRYLVKARGAMRTASYCRDCVNAKSRARYDPARAAADYRRWRIRNADYDRLRHKRYEEEHREEKNAAMRRFRANNPGYFNHYVREYYARQRGAAIEYVDRLVVLERDDGVCGICGEDVDPTFFHVDHIYPLALGGAHSYENTQPAHPSCNKRKRCKVISDDAVTIEIGLALSA